MSQRTMGRPSIFASIRGVNGNKFAAVVIWLVSAYGTSLLIESLRSGSSPYSTYMQVDGAINSVVTLVWGSTFLAAVVLQSLFTIGERPIWNGNNWDVVSGVAIVFDVLTNAAALWPFVVNFGNSSVWAMLVDIMQSINPSISGEFHPIAGFAVAIIGGIIGAAGPEKLWGRA